MGEQFFFDKCPYLCAGNEFGQRKARTLGGKAIKVQKVIEKLIRLAFQVKAS